MVEGNTAGKDVSVGAGNDVLKVLDEPNERERIGELTRINGV